MTKGGWKKEPASRLLCSSHVGEYSPLPPKGNKSMWFSVIPGFVLFFVSPSLSTGLSTKTGCWWVPDLALVAVLFPALWCSLPRHWHATQTSASCSFCCSWTRLFLSLSPQALPTPLSRSVGHGRGLLSSLPPAAYQLSAAQDEPSPFPLGKGAALAEHTFPRSCCVLWFLISMLLSLLSGW